MGQYDIYLHSHALFWFITMVLFVLTVIILKSGKVRLARIVQMSLRGFYILVLISGFALVVKNIWWGSILKGLFAIWLIYVMEMISTRMAKKELTMKSSIFLWIQFIISLLLVLYFGYLI
ncbi:YisL family protein [Salipaludibacillus sp. HK11]|uniref:YisL family protein n=1 Tax=Salipaludibacillus sp. HK11 TaxID=3394320 RepID=UPI0039FC2D19